MVRPVNLANVSTIDGPVGHELQATTAVVLDRGHGTAIPLYQKLMMKACSSQTESEAAAPAEKLDTSH
jgi:hypothetical protein